MPRRRAEPPKGTKKKARSQPPVTTKAAPPRHGGARPGAGRPAKVRADKDGEIPWSAVERYAVAGALESEILTAFEITEAMLADRPVADQFKALIKRGHAQHRIDLREQIKNRGNRTNKGAGSVNALALQARNYLDWDRDVPQQMAAPDLVGARARLRDTLTRLAAARSEVEGRVVTPLEIIYREAFGQGAEVPPTDLKRG